VEPLSGFMTNPAGRCDRERGADPPDRPGQRSGAESGYLVIVAGTPPTWGAGQVQQ